MKVTFKDSADKMSIEECIYFYAIGIAVSFDEGQHVTFVIERADV